MRDSVITIVQKADADQLWRLTFNTQQGVAADRLAPCVGDAGALLQAGACGIDRADREAAAAARLGLQ